MSNSTVLVTGGFGFLGRAVALKFKHAGYRVIGIGRGHWAPEEATKRGFDVWLNAGVTLSSLMTIKERFGVIAHCAGNGSVQYSLTNPLQEFNKTVQSTADLLEYVRLTGSESMVIYPSSAGVYGAKEDKPMKETDEPNPISPYGFHKHIVEQLLASSSRSYGVRATVIRFFSIYGPGLTKQLLWDASVKIRAQNEAPAIFWGTGEETRDWIFIDDAAELIFTAAGGGQDYAIINGASGIRTTVKETLIQLCRALNLNAKFSFNHIVREGDPRFYHADVSKAADLGWRPIVGLPEGVDRYVRWLLAHDGAPD